jgi:hypothetical protein
VFFRPKFGLKNPTVRQSPRLKIYGKTLFFICIFDKANVFLDVSAMTGLYTCSTLLCLSIFLMVVHQVELENKPIYFWAFWASAIFIPVIVSFKKYHEPNQEPKASFIFQESFLFDFHKYQFLQCLFHCKVLLEVRVYLEVCSQIFCSDPRL